MNDRAVRSTISLRCLNCKKGTLGPKWRYGKRVCNEMRSGLLNLFQEVRGAYGCDVASYVVGDIKLEELTAQSRSEAQALAP